MSEQQIEQEIQEKGLNAPRLTPDHIDAQITGQQFFVFPGTTVTICLLTLRNGFTVTGESACASPENFDEEIGRKIARDQARDKIWMLEGYLLKEKLHTSEKFEAYSGDNCVSSMVHGGVGMNAASSIPNSVRDDIFMLTQVLSCRNGMHYLEETASRKLEMLINQAFPEADEKDKAAEQPSTPKARVEQERAELGVKLVNLKKFLSCSKPEFISQEHWNLLNEQQEHMDKYYDILEQRLEMF